ncbi:cupin domain-containing protein [Actinomycetes bacterium KLBMP 9797]
MRKLKLTDLADGVRLPGMRIADGGVATIAPGEMSHPEGRHVHPDPEGFLILDGRGRILIDGVATEFTAGDVLIVEPGEDHHLVCDGDRPVVNTWLHFERAAG